MRPVASFINDIFRTLGMGQFQIPMSVDISSNANTFARNFAMENDLRISGGSDAVTNRNNFGTRMGSTGGGGAGLATGGLVKATPGGRQYTIGEGGVDEAVIPLSRAGLSSAGLGGQTVFNLSGIMTTNRSETARMIRELWQEQIKQGTIPRGSIA
jgi:hypothetical protein